VIADRSKYFDLFTTDMTKHIYPAVLIIVVLFILPLASHATQLDEGIQAYDAQDYSMAYQRLLPLAEQGDGKSQYYVGEMLVGGMGIPADMDKGIYWLEQSVESKYYMAAKTLGKMYMSGFGVPMDPEKGAKYLLLYQSLLPEAETEPECD
jgi:hypothetical protein